MRPRRTSRTPFKPAPVYYREESPVPSNDGTYLSDDLAKLQIDTNARTSWTEEWHQNQAFGNWERSPSPVLLTPPPKPLIRSRSRVKFSLPEITPPSSTLSPPPSPTPAHARRARAARPEIEKALGEDAAPEFFRRSQRLRAHKSAGKLVEEKEIAGRKRPAATKPKGKATKGVLKKKGAA